MHNCHTIATDFNKSQSREKVRLWLRGVVCERICGMQIGSRGRMFCGASLHLEYANGCNELHWWLGASKIMREVRERIVMGGGKDSHLANESFMFQLFLWMSKWATFTLWRSRLRVVGWDPNTLWQIPYFDKEVDLSHIVMSFKKLIANCYGFSGLLFVWALK